MSVQDEVDIIKDQQKKDFQGENLGIFRGNTKQTVTITDIICEGPIAGLVQGQSSVFLNDDRAVPLALGSENYATDEQGTPYITLTSGSTTGTVENLTESQWKARDTDALPDRWLIVKSVAVVPTVTVKTHSDFMADINDPYHLSSMRHGVYIKSPSANIPKSGFTINGNMWQNYKPARLVAKTNEPGQDVRATIPGWIVHILDLDGGTTTAQNGPAVDQQGAIFLPGGYGRYAGGASGIPLGDYELQLDSIHELAASNSISFSGGKPILTLKYAWGGAAAPFSTGDYGFNLIASSDSSGPAIESSKLVTYTGSQTQFRTGTKLQPPFSALKGGEGSSSTTNSNPGAGGSLEWTTGFGGSQAPKVLVASGSTGFNLSATQIEEVDEIRLSFQYAGGLYAINGDGNTQNTVAQYKIELGVKRNSADDFEDYIVVDDPNEHISGSKNAVVFQPSIEMTQYRPFVDFRVRVSRKTDHQGDGYNKGGGRQEGWQNISAVTLSNVTSVIKEPVYYPYTSLAKVAYNTGSFQSVPKRSYHVRGSLIRVPSNYITREETSGNQALYNRNVSTAVQENTYQDWDGNFRKHLVYTNNPAWVFYDILVNNRYGLGNFLEKSDIDIYQLYRIGRYCDELVDDGTGSGILEPRFTCNLFLTKQVDAFKVLKDMLTVFRGMLYFIDGQIAPQYDAPSGPVYNFSKANTINGGFKYEGTGSKTRINQVHVTWNNPEKNYEQEVILVEDRADIAKTGKIISQDSMAFGCTSEGQARRYGRWKLWTAANQTEVVSFATGLNGSFLRPGDVVNVQDADKAGVRFSGRISSDIESRVTLSTTKSAGSIGSNSTGFDATNRTSNVVMAGEAILPSSFSQDECLFEYGASGQGIWIGVREISSEYKFVYRTGDGGTSQTATDTHTIIGELPVDEIPEFDGQSHTIAWEIQPDNGKAYLWIDGRLVFELETTDGSNLDGGIWSGSNVGGWGQGFGATVGNYALTAWSGAIQSDLRIYNSQITTDKITLDSPVTLYATSTYKLGVVFVEPAAFLAQDTATINSVNYVRGDLIDKAFIDSNGDGTYTLQKVNSQVDSINAKTTASATDALQLTWSEHLRVEEQTISNNGANITHLSTSSAFESVPQRSHIWVIQEVDDSGNVTTSSKVPYRILSIAEKSAESYEITGVRYYDDKYSAVEKDFTTYVADPVFTDTSAQDIVPTPVGVNVSSFPGPGENSTTILVSWSAPEDSNNAEEDYRHLSGFVIEHDIPGRPSGYRASRAMRHVTFSNVPPGKHIFAVRTENILGNLSEAVVESITIMVGNDITDGFNDGYFPPGIRYGGSLSGRTFISRNKDFRVPSSYTFQATGNSKKYTATVRTATDARGVQDVSGMPSITYAGNNGTGFEYDIFYMLFDVSDNTDPLKLCKIYRSEGVTYWYNTGNGSGTNRTGSNLTGTITGTKNSSRARLLGSGTSFTTELVKGDVIHKASGEVLGIVQSISSDTRLTLDRRLKADISSINFKIPNIRIDKANDSFIAALYNDQGTIEMRALTSTDTSIHIDQGKRTAGLTYYWPLNSVIGGKMVEAVQGASAVAAGTAPTVSADSPVGKSIQNDDGQVLLEDTAVEALEESANGFAYSFWFKSEGNNHNAHARMLTRDQSELWGIGVDQSAGNYDNDGLQNLRIWRAGTSVTIKTDVVEFNTWQHIGVAYDGTILQFFLDGKLIHTDTGYDPTAVNGNTLILGKNQATGNKFTGKFTEVKAFNRYLTEDELFSEYNNPGGTVAPLIDQDFQQGDTDGNVFKVTSDGISLGHTTFSSAPFRVDMAGNLNATSATVTGSITGASVIADTVTIGGGTAGDVVTGSDIIGAGSVNQNPNMTLVAPDGRPQGVLSAFGSASIGNISYQDAAKTVLKLHTSTGSDNTTGAVWPAFRINPDARYKVLVRWKATAASSNGAYLRIEELDTELPIGKTHISHNSAASEAAVNEDTREINLWNNNAIGTSYTDQIFDYIPTSTAKWASALALNWSGMGTAEMHIDLLYIVEDTSVKSQGSVGGWTIDSDAIFAGTKKTTDDFSASAGDITISSTGAIRANKFLLKANGDAEFKGDITGATGTFAGELAAGSLTVDKLSGDFNEEYATQFRSVQTGDHTLASTLGTYSTIQEFSIPAPGGVAKAVKISGTLSTKAFNGTGSTQSTEYSIHLEMKAKGTAATNLGTAAADAVSAGTTAETVYISGNKLKEFGSAGSVSAAADGSSGQGNVIGVYYDAPTNRTYIQYIDASVSFDSGDTIHYSAENFTTATGFVQIQTGFDDSTDRQSVIALPHNETFYDKTYLSASLPKTTTATEFRLRVRNRKVLPSGLSVTFPTGAFKLEHIV